MLERRRRLRRQENLEAQRKRESDPMYRLNRLQAGRVLFSPRLPQWVTAWFQRAAGVKMCVLRLQRNLRRAYYTAVSLADRRLGELLDALDEAGVYDQTIVIAHSDHGYMLGEVTL